MKRDVVFAYDCEYLVQNNNQEKKLSSPFHSIMIKTI